MAKLSEVVAFLDNELRTNHIPDYPGAHNGLQMENASGEVHKVVSAVDGSLAVIEEAAALGADLLVVHHGLFWQGVRMMTGAYYKKVKLAIDGGLAVYSSHLPLDLHPEWGNNIGLAKAIGLDVLGSFLPWKGIELGLRGEMPGMSLGDLVARVRGKVGPVIFTGQPEQSVGRVGVITGGAGSEIEAAKAEGLDTFVTGEGPHWSFPLADEIGLNVIHAGHYATEIYGVKAAGLALAKQFDVCCEFVDRPTGL